MLYLSINFFAFSVFLNEVWHCSQGLECHRPLIVEQPPYLREYPSTTRKGIAEFLTQIFQILEEEVTEQ